jgi:hypothetical protein
MVPKCDTRVYENFRTPEGAPETKVLPSGFGTGGIITIALGHNVVIGRAPDTSWLAQRDHFRDYNHGLSRSGIVDSQHESEFKVCC